MKAEHVFIVCQQNYNPSPILGTLNFFFFFLQ